MSLLHFLIGFIIIYILVALRTVLFKKLIERDGVALTFQGPSLKMTILLGVTALFLLLVLNLPTAFANETKWHEQAEEGWFFYNEELPVPEVEEEPVVEKQIKEAPKEVKAPPPPEPAVVPSVEPVQPYTVRMKEKGEQLLSAAMENPTQENVEQYMVHNQLMMQASTDFAEAWQLALMKNPDLESGVPMVDAVKDIYYEEQARKDDEKLQSLKERAGLFFFYTTSCPYCPRQAQYLKLFENQTGFEVKAISLDGYILPEYPDAIADNGIATELNVKGVPAIYLALPPNTFERVATGIITPEELKRRLILYETQVGDS